MDDLISRQAAIDAVCMEWCGVKHQDCKHPFDAEKDDYYWCDGCETALRTLPDLPSAEPEKACIAKITLSEEQVREAFEKAKSEIVQVLPSAQTERRCVNCGRTVNNGGWYEDGRTRCPIEEHYALPKDGYCHLWEKRKDWEDDYVKRAEEGEK